MKTVDNDPVLVVADDKPDVRGLLAELGEDAALQVIACKDATSAMAAVDKYIELGTLIGVVSDLRMPGTDDSKEWGGWELLSHAYRASKTISLAVYTSYGGHEVNTLFKAGVAVPAFTMFEKPTHTAELGRWMVAARAKWDDSFGLTLKDADTRRIYEELAPVYARSSLTMLVLGETGTGKESLAELIHNTSRRPGPFLPINCGGLESTLAFSELFGHTAGAFTDAKYHELGLVLRASGYRIGRRQGSSESFVDWLKSANPDLEEQNGLLGSRTAEQGSGTLFLDEVATLPPKVMAGLLRLLESGDIVPLGHYGPGIRSYCRVLAATNEVNVLRNSLSDSSSEIVRFRRDLCYRLGGAILTLAPLRDRSAADIRHFVEKVVWRKLGIAEMSVDHSALNKIVALYQERTDDIARQYQLGNFRTLRNLVHRAVLLARAETATSISLTHVELAIKHGELKVQELELTSHERHVQDIFRKALNEHGLNIAEQFSKEELTEITRNHPLASAYAFLRCALVDRQPPHPQKRYYDLAEIETALVKGMSRNVWLGKTLDKEHVRQAALAHFEIEANDLPEAIEIRNIVNKIRG